MTAWNKTERMRVHQQEPFNAEPAPATLAEGRRTSLEAFYSRNHGPIPDIDPGQWRLRVDGMVHRPLELTMDQLHSDFEPAQLEATLACAGNRRAELLDVRDIPGEAAWGPCAISTASFRGVRLAEVLHAAGLERGAAHIAFEAPDVAPSAHPPQPYGGSIPVSKALQPEVLLAWDMNEQPLPRAHGAPLRVVVPGWIGARSVKWLTRITARTEPSDNYFQATAYRMLPADTDPEQAAPGEGISLGPIALNCAILQPEDGRVLPAGATRITGYALSAPNRAVERVDVSADGGLSWRQATLDSSASPWTWRTWQISLELPPGEHDLTARAWDATGSTTPESPAHVWNPQGYGNNSWPRIHLTCR